MTASKKITYVALTTAILCVLAPISIPIGVIPISLATLVIFTMSACLGFKIVTTSTIVYVCLGLVGLPVFSMFQGGFSVLVGSSGGYIIGYIFASFIIGFITEKTNKTYMYILSMLIGLICCYLFGTLWYSYLTSIKFVIALKVTVLPFLIIDFIKIALSVFLAKTIRKRIAC